MTAWRGPRLRDALRLYVITDRGLARGRPESEIAREAIAGGATAIQLRWKTGPLSEALRVGRELRELCRQSNVLFVVNDRVDLALVLEADGVHLGVNDVPVADARQLVGQDMVIGFSPETLEQAIDAEAAGADYLGVGPVFPTRTKLDAGPAVGLGHLERIARAVRIPVVGIGGITVDNAGAVIRAGAVGVAVISAVVGADDVRAAAARLRQVVDEAAGLR
ncbi:MAG: thiamine phosphate synthase [Thermomicrobium sp.]|nr:thiamine phosphate synthase [Thermomicrobium sp.]MDW7982303.1 thiamine phosphate synthase [Thermomicrobium sp.]